MRSLSLFKKTMIENFRDWKILIFTVTMAPFFVVLIYFYFIGTITTFPIRMAVVNNDRGVTTAENIPFSAGQALISEMMRVRYTFGAEMLKVYREEDMIKARELLKKKSVDLVVEIPADFSKTLINYKEVNRTPPVKLKIYGDPANNKYNMALSFCDTIFQLNMILTGQKGPLELKKETVAVAKKKKSQNSFDLYVPALLVLALICMMFTAAATLIKEKDKGTLIRLRLSNMTINEYLTAISLAQIIIGMLALGLTFLTALALGYKTSGSLFAAAVVGVLSSMAIIAISLLVAALLRTIFDLMTVGCFPFFILMFFSGGMMPIPPLSLLTIGGRTIDVNEILPTTHSIKALGKILSHQAGLGDVAFEIGAIVVLTIIYFTAGLWLFRRRHFQPK